MQDNINTILNNALVVTNDNPSTLEAEVWNLLAMPG